MPAAGVEPASRYELCCQPITGPEKVPNESIINEAFADNAACRIVMIGVFSFYNYPQFWIVFVDVDLIHFVSPWLVLIMPIQYAFAHLKSR